MNKKLTLKNEGRNAFRDGMEDAINGREQKNASDCYGPYSYYYMKGYVKGYAIWDKENYESTKPSN